MTGVAKQFIAVLLALTLSACGAPSQVCDYRTTSSTDGVVRVALLIGVKHFDHSEIPGVDAEIARIRTLLGQFDFANSNICSITGARATAENARRGLREFSDAGPRNAVKFLYVATNGAVAIDNDADEPDEYDETLVFADADGTGSGELSDDELDRILEQIQSSSAGSLSIFNAGYYSRTDTGTANERVWDTPPKSRQIESVETGDGDGAPGLHNRGRNNHLVASPGHGSAGNGFAEAVASVLSDSIRHSPTYRQLARRLSFELRAAGMDVEISGEGTDSLFGLYRAEFRALNSNAVTLTLNVRTGDSYGNLTSDDRDYVKDSIGSGNAAIQLVEGHGEFELSMDGDGNYVLRGPAGRARNRFADLIDLPTIIGNHLTHKRLRGIRGNDDQVLEDFRSLNVNIRPNRDQLDCATGTWDQAPESEVQQIPICFAWYVEVENTAPETPLNVLLLVLSSDGETLVIPGSRDTLVSGVNSYSAQGQILGAKPPIDLVEQVLAIGSTAPLDVNGLLRGTGGAPDGSRWTVAARAYTVVANSAFLQEDELTQREYTIKNFDIRPYLPDDDTTTLSRFLLAADGLAMSSIVDGYPYLQHGWTAGSDEENLKLGIDCSRSIWYAFTRSGLNYNRADRYLTTADMVTANTLMADEFEACPNDDYVVGDILVYRSEERGDGHVVAVIDPEKRIAWGSHGWDGNPNAGLALEPDTGVEYQKIRVKKDWRRWDRSDMELRSCWRYRRFTEELRGGRGGIGTKMLEVTCEEDICFL